MIKVARKLTVPAVRVSQPIGDFFVASVDARRLVEISWVDVRRMSDQAGEIDNYIGIQRRISSGRVDRLRSYVASSDATFPTSIVVAVPEVCASYSEENRQLTLSEVLDENTYDSIVDYANIAKILDGQHRIRAFANPVGQQFLFDNELEGRFELCVSIFVGADLPTQATIFSIVNLAQTKVNKSLVYDLYSLARTRSPQKSAHFIAVGLDSHQLSPFYSSIKRLGSATPGRTPGTETLTQATFVECVVPLLSSHPERDRDFYLREPSGTPPLVWSNDEPPLFRHLFLGENEGRVAQIIWGFFEAVSRRWPIAWRESPKGNILKRTNGFRALMSVLPIVYVRHLGGRHPGELLDSSVYEGFFRSIPLSDGDISVERFSPGSSGEANFRRLLLSYLN